MRLLTTLLLLSAIPLYSQTGPPPRVRTVVQSVNITTDSSISSENLRRIESKLRAGLGYPPDPGRFVQKIAKAELESNGYYKGDVTTLAIAIVSETATKRYIAVTLRIREGEQYRLKQIVFENNKVLSAAQLRPVFPIQDGDVADGWKIEQGLQAMRNLYARTGYLQITPVVKPSPHDETHMLTLYVNVQKGPQFTVLGLTLEGNRPWPADKAEKLQALAPTYQGSHNVGVFVEAVKQTMKDIFPGCDADTLVAVTEGGEVPHATVNVSWPEDFPLN